MKGGVSEEVCKVHAQKLSLAKIVFFTSHDAANFSQSDLISEEHINLHTLC